MASTKEIKRRIKSVKSTKKITKAMELVAASKMKRAISQTLSSRLYANYSWEILTSLSNRMEEITHPFFNENIKKESTDDSNKDLIVLITSNRGLCGGYNSQVIKKVISILKKGVAKPQGFGKVVDIIAVGKKGDSSMRKVGQKIVASFTEIPDVNIKITDILPLATFITEEFKKKTYENVYIAYTDFVSALSQKPKTKKILPISKKDIEESLNEGMKEKMITTQEVPYLFEGDVYNLLESIVEKIVRMQIYQMFLESNASEQSSRMVAMKNANEAAGEMIDDLTLVFNKARQSGITREISEISAGMAASVS